MGQETMADVAIVGAGFGGIAALHMVRSLGYEAIVLEAGAGPGGTWYWNRYPGARCDIESRQYSFGLFPEIAQQWTWTEKFATQPEILAYLDHVVDAQDMRGAIRFDTRVTRVHYDDAAARWRLGTDNGTTLSARYCILATGTLSTANLPSFPGIEDFKGAIHHTGLWPHEGVDMAGKRVGVIGTGSSGVQLIPHAARAAAHLSVFMRTPYFVVPARNRPLEDDEIAETKAAYPQLRDAWRRSPNAVGMSFGRYSAMDVDAETRHAMFEAAWAAGGGDFGACFNDLSRNMESNAEVARYFRWKIAQLVENSETAAALTPSVQWGTRRLCIGTDYYKTYNRDNVLLVDLRKTPVERVTATGLVCNGVEHPLDMLLLATGFDAVTGTLLRMDVRGRHGLRLEDLWRDGPRTYLGMAVSGFPNMFMISGPQTPGTLINMAVGSEMHAAWIGRCIAWADARGATAIEAEEGAQADWLAHTDAIAAQSLMSKGDSWWTGGNIPGKPRGYLGYLDWLGYAKRCDEVADAGYEGFALHDARPDGAGTRAPSADR